MRKLLLFGMVLILMGCKTVEYVPVVPEMHLPALDAVYPERPELLELPAGTTVHENININLVRLIGYIEKMESYADELLSYIGQIDEALEAMRDADEK